MAVSRSPGHDRQPARTTDADDWLPDLSRYDLVLAVIPALFVGALLAHVVVGFPLAVAVVPASLVGIALLADAVFLNPPTAPPSRRP